jgi:hypothetical protein
MKVKFLQQFDKDIDKIKETNLKAEIADIILTIEKASSLKELQYQEAPRL